LKQVRWSIDILRGSKIDVVCSGSIMDSEPLKLKAAEQLKKVLDLGAVAAAGTTFYYESSRGWAEDTDRLLREFGGIS
jgi:hypothetical protein